MLEDAARTYDIVPCVGTLDEALYYTQTVSEANKHRHYPCDLSMYYPLYDTVEGYNPLAYFDGSDTPDYSLLITNILSRLMNVYGLKLK